VTEDGPCQAQPVLPGGRCRVHGGASTGPKTEEGKAIRKACQSALAVQQWDEAWAEGKTRLGELSPDGRASIVNANAGRPKSPEQRAKMSKSHVRLEAAKRQERYSELIAEHGAMLANIFQEQRGPNAS
jgi:hypothetical protein